MMRKIITVAFVASLVAPGWSGAQDISTLGTGARVRAVWIHGERTTGSLQSLTQDSATILSSRDQLPVSFALGSVKLQRSAGVVRSHRALKVLGGFVLGAALGGAITNLASPRKKCTQGCFGVSSHDANVFGGVLLGGVAGAVLGGAAGSHERWIDVQLPGH
jgi:hypothetical protein